MHTERVNQTQTELKIRFIIVCVGQLDSIKSQEKRQVLALVLPIQFCQL